MPTLPPGPAAIVGGVRFRRVELDPKPRTFPLFDERVLEPEGLRIRVALGDDQAELGGIEPADRFLFGFGVLGHGATGHRRD